MRYRSVFPCLAVAAAVLALGQADGQTTPTGKDGSKYAGSVQRSVDTEILADAETVFPMDGNLVLRGYSNRRRVDQPAIVTHAVVMIHGILRDPESYYLPARRVLKRKSLFTRVALISVGFDSPTSAPRNVQRLAKFTSRWKYGDFGGLDPEDPHNMLSSFAAMNRILVDLTKTYPQLRRITLIGHSAGAQFVDRYSVLSSIASEAPAVAFRFVALAPSTALYPNELRPKVAEQGRLVFSIPSAISDYDMYPYGLSPTPLLERLLGHPAAGRARLIGKLIDRDIVFAVGTDDTGTRYLDKSRSADTQGPNRYTRLKYFVEFLKSRYPSTRARLLTISGVGHNSQRLIESPEMEEFFSER
jgi:pimeloyl-ACP methyl ester carboxylesterase